MKQDFKRAFNHHDEAPLSAQVYGWELPPGPETVEEIAIFDRAEP